jgi:spermidine dehydrogenase
MANGAWTSQYVVADVPESYRDAFTDFVRAPMLVVNVALERWRFMYDLGITAASYRDVLGFSCNIRQSMVVGDYRPTLHPDKPTILTFYIPFERPGSPIKAQATAARTEMLGTSYRDYERRIREQLVRLFARAGFDSRADIAGIVLNRWGHAYVCPAPGFYFGRNGKPAAPEVLRQPLGRIAFANSELNGHQNWVDATGEGKRAVEQLLA